jgi:membrane protease YdiL (CAAX protease family)
MVIRALIVSGLIAAAAFAPNAYLWLMGALVIGGFAWSLYCRVTRGYWG